MLSVEGSWLLSELLAGLPPSIKFAGTQLYTWVVRGTVTVKCFAQEHNTTSPARAQTRTARSGVERTNHEATAPPTRSLRFYVNVLDFCIGWMTWNLWTLLFDINANKRQIRLRTQLFFFSFQILDEHPGSLGRRRRVVKKTYGTINLIKSSSLFAVGTRSAIIKGAPLNLPTGISMM